MSSDVQQCEPVPETQSPQKRKSLDHQDVDEPEPKKTTSHLYTKLKHSIITSQYSHLNKLSTQIELALLEKYFLDNRLVYSDYPKWLEVHSKTPRNKILRDYLLSHFNPTELTALSDKCSAQLDLKLAVSTPTAASSSAEQFKSMAECAKHEAQVLQRISELRKQGLWSIKRLPKLVEPARAKTHWDYLLDEMVWMSTDFVQERKWKVNTCRKISAAVHKHFREREARWETAERDEQKRVRKQAAAVAREVQQFWKQVAKLIEYKQRSISEEKRKIQMDQQLNFIVDQTEKYSSWLVQSLNQSKERSDDEVCRLGEVSDNESTIESDEDRPVDDELAQLTQESQLDLNVLLKDYNLDESYFCQNFAKEQDDESSESDENEDEEIVSDDMSEEEDDEETIEQDEKMDNEYDAQKELDELKADFELPIEQLLEKLKKPNDENQEASSSTDQNDGLDSIAAHAESFQPTGYTLETTNVKTRIPSELLKHNLREYQHVGLDWLVTMYENKLNGILADEMGLGKTIQTIALLAHLAVDKAVWGPHLIVVPTSVMLNWELEFKKWSPGFKILTYYGSQKERKLKRIGWTKTNAFHVCITSYKLVIQDHAIFRRKKWKYFILDEAQNIKNFKSQRWQTLLNFQSQRRLLLTGTPLQNNLMELWSLMHFLMPHVFASHRQFNQWFNNPFKTMIEKSTEVNEQLIKRLHKVLRPFILRRLKAHVEKQMPKKYEHVIKCALSKRQRLLYDEFMSLSSTREKIAQGHYMSVINILMQLRKVCNHPDLFEPRPIVSSFVSQPIEYQVPSMVFNLSDELFAVHQLSHYHPGIADIETMSAFDSHRAKRLQLSSKHIEQCLAQTHAKPRDHVTWANFFQDKSLVGIRSSSVHSSCPQQHTSADLTDHSIKANYLSRLNKLRFIFHKPVYGRDLIEYVNNIRVSQCDSKSFATRSYATCEMSRASGDYLEYTNALRQIVNWLRDYLMHEMESVCEKFVMYVPHVRYSSSDYVTMRIANPHAAQYRKYTSIKQPIKNVCVHTGFARLNQIVNTLTSTQFPDKRLIQYDCGKLQKLDSLLRQLFSGEHRVLLFTQMTRMLDVLENFLNYHGYKYLRLDGATSIEQRQVLMERFNTDKRIFCFILSTRSGGVGVNLTGADTVVFYDSDWNPTMDAQAQDRCHRIGQTRDVHIYRLISEKTVEENILKKADQKRLLSQMAIEGGCFTTAVLRKSHITELFEEEEHQEPVIEENNESSVGQIDDTKFEEALGMVEDESDVNAAKNLRQEVQADIAEFDENENLTDDADMVKLHTEFKFIETELKPIERYALKYLESTGEVQIENDAEPDIEQVKKSWELERLKRLKEEEERKAEQEEEDLMYTYTKTEIWINDYSDQMPLWCPLTPPSNDRDVYIDTYDASNYLYDSEPIAEELLPPVTYSKRGDKRLKIDLISPSKQKQQNLQNIQSQTSSQQLSAQSNQSIVKSSIKSLENIIIPRPLFDKTNTTLIKLRRDVKMQKLKGWPTFKMDIVKSTLPIQPEFSGKDDWLPNDDFNIIYALQVVLELPLNLQPIAPSHQVNWDLVSDMVSSGFTKQYRSPQECRKRFENVILKREELCLTEIQNKKQQMLQAEQSATKIKTANKPVVLNITKTKTLRTNQLFLQDNFKQLVQNQNRRFDKITSIGKKRHQSQFSIFSVQQPSQFTAYSLQQPLGPAQQLNHQNLLSRFNSSLPQTPIVSSFVTNATNALITAIKQTHTQTSSINADSIHFRTPKYFSDMKILKEKQAKQASLVVTSPVASQVPASPSQTQPIKQTQTASPSPSAHKNQTILSHLQQQQRATSALAAQLAASAAAVAQQSIEKPKQQQTSPMTPNQPQTVQQHLQKPQSISAIIQNQQNQTIFYQNQQAQSQSSLRSLVQSTSPATQTINQQQQQQQQQQPQITIAVPISSSGSGSQTISSIINNQQLHQSSGQQAIRFYPNQSNKNSSLNELRKKTTVAGITAAAAAAASSVQPPQSPSQVTTQTKQLIQQQKINKQMQQQMSVQKPASQSPVVVAQQQSSGQQNVPAVQRSSPATSILIRQNPQSNMPKATIQQTIQQIQQQQQQQQGVQAVKQEEPAAKQNATSNAQNQAGVQANQQTPQVITVQSANSSTNVNTVQNIVSRQQSSTGQPSTITTLIKPINNVSLSNQQKQGIIMTNQPQFRQFQLMSNSSSQNSQNGQVVIQQPNIVMNTNTGQPQTTIRKVGSSTNISTLQQKVQVINRGNIQIVQANSGQRLTKTTPLNTTSVSSSTSNSTPIQFQQAFQQQTAKQSAPNSNQTTSVSTLTSGATMPTLKTSITPAQKSSSTPTTVKTLLASSNQASNFSIISTSAGVNTSGIPQAIPINSSLSQVLRQLGNQNNLSINIQSLNSINASPIQLIQATSSNSGTNVSDSNENSNNSEPTLAVGSNNNSNLTSSQNENKQ